MKKLSYYERNKERAIYLATQYRLNNKEKYNEYQREYKRKNYEKIRAIKRKSYLKHRTKYLLASRAYYWVNRAFVLKRAKEEAEQYKALRKSIREHRKSIFEENNELQPLTKKNTRRNSKQSVTGTETTNGKPDTGRS